MRGAVEGDERAVAPGVGRVDRLGDQLLAGAGFSPDQDRRAERADVLDQVEDPCRILGLLETILWNR